MAKSTPSNPSPVSFNSHCPLPIFFFLSFSSLPKTYSYLPSFISPRRRPDATHPPFSFREWLSTFLEDQHPYYHSSDSSQEDIPSSTEIPSDGLDDIDEGIIESLIIIALAGALAFLIYYRNQRQTNHRRGLEGQQQQQAQQQPQQQQPQQQAQAQLEPQQGQVVPDGQQADGGFFPPPDDPGYPQWIAGGVGH